MKLIKNIWLLFPYCAIAQYGQPLDMAVPDPGERVLPGERQLTFDPWNHDLDNNDNFSPDDEWILYDHRDDVHGVAGTSTISRVNARTGKTEVVYCHENNKPWGPGVAAASFNPRDGRVVVMSGLDTASEARPYELWRRTCAIVTADGKLCRLDARDVTEPFTPGALRGGTHRPEWSADGQWIGFTYDDAVLTERELANGRKFALRTIGVAKFADKPVMVDKAPENNNGVMYSVIVAKVTPTPAPGSDEIKKAFEDAWIGARGYRRPDGKWQHRARAFMGTLVSRTGLEYTEVFVVDIPDQLNQPEADVPIVKTLDMMPQPPHGTIQRRLTFTESRKFPGLALQPRHWLRSSKDGTAIVYLAKDDAGITQAFVVNPESGRIDQITYHDTSIQSCVRWSPDDSHILYVCNNAVTVCSVKTALPWEKRVKVLTHPSKEPPEAPVWSNNGMIIAFNRRVVRNANESAWKQIFLIHPKLKHQSP